MAQETILIQQTSNGFPFVEIVGAAVLLFVLVGSFVLLSRILSNLAKPLAEKEVQSALLAVAGVVAAGWLTSKLLKAGFEFLQDIEWDDVNPRIKAAIEEAAREISFSDASENLKRVSELLVSEKTVDLDLAAMLASATLERGLKTLVARHNIFVADDARGLAGLAIALLDSELLDEGEVKRIKYFSSAIRNKVVHGEFGRQDRSSVADMFEFIEAFFERHDIG